MKIRCKNCGHEEETNVDFFVKVIGAAMPVGGYWAWTAYLFAGTGFAMGIVIAIIAGGTAILAYKDEIVQWVVDRGYKCEVCGLSDWTAVDESASLQKNLRFVFR